MGPPTLRELPDCSKAFQSSDTWRGLPCPIWDQLAAWCVAIRDSPLPKNIYIQLAASARALGCGQAARLTTSTDAGCPQAGRTISRGPSCRTRNGQASRRAPPVRLIAALDESQNRCIQCRFRLTAFRRVRIASGGERGESLRRVHRLRSMRADRVEGRICGPRTFCRGRSQVRAAKTHVLEAVCARGDSHGVADDGGDQEASRTSRVG